MGKVLTISIAAYNIEKTIRKAVESCLQEEITEDIEILIENDGSTDRTSEIAHEYERAYPESVRVIDKENGGYGSTVNRSVREARGKYLKLLDGDDWFDAEGIVKLVRFLKTCDADLVLSGRPFAKETGEESFEITNPPNRWEKLYGENLGGQTVELSKLTPFVFGMWFATYKTELFRASNWRDLPEHMLYTDGMVVVYPLAAVKTVAFQDYPVYYYRVGTEEQSVSAENRMRHFGDALKGVRLLMRYYAEMKGQMEEANRDFEILRIARYYNNVVNTVMLFPPSRKHKTWIQKMERELLRTSPEIYRRSGEVNRMIARFRRWRYWPYWIYKLKKTENWY